MAAAVRRHWGLGTATARPVGARMKPSAPASFMLRIRQTCATSGAVHLTPAVILGDAKGQITATDQPDSAAQVAGRALALWPPRTGPPRPKPSPRCCRTRPSVPSCKLNDHRVLAVDLHVQYPATTMHETRPSLRTGRNCGQPGLPLGKWPWLADRAQQRDLARRSPRGTQGCGRGAGLCGRCQGR